MARRLRRGQIWLYTFRSPDKRRPVLIVSRPDVIDLLDTVMVAPITSTVRGAPGEVIVGVEEGLKARSAANLDHVQTVRKDGLRSFVGSVDEATMAGVCRALLIATGCAD